LFSGTLKKEFLAALREAGVDVILMTGIWGIVGGKDEKRVRDELEWL